MKTQLKTFVNIPVWQGGLEPCVAHIFSLFLEKKSCHIVTLNAEMLLCANEFEPVRAAIMSADVWVADSMTARWFFGRKNCGTTISRIPGVDLAERLVVEAGKRSLPVIILGGADSDVRNKATTFIESHGAHVCLALDGPQLLYDKKLSTSELEDIIKKISELPKALIIIAFGHGKQERVAEYIRQQIPSGQYILIGAGGTLDMWAGRTPRAPQWMRLCGIEWLWRVIIEPTRLPRIVRAIIIFPLRVLFDL